MLLFQTIPPGVLHLCCFMVALRKRLVDDDDADDYDKAPEVQTNFISSQNFTIIIDFVISIMTMTMNNIITIILFGIPKYCHPSSFFPSCCSCFMLLRIPQEKKLVPRDSITGCIAQKLST